MMTSGDFGFDSGSLVAGAGQAGIAGAKAGGWCRLD
jgi:hypothetical protein